MNTAAQWRFAARSLRRDWHSGELRVLALALVVAVASVTAIGFFTDRVGRAVERQAGDVIAADLKVSSNFALPAGLAEEASASGLSVAGFRRFASVVINEDDESQLVAVKAVSGGYPLRGQLELASPEAPEAVRSLAGPALPEPGTLWVSPQLAAALALEPGQPLTLGSIEFEVAKILVYEPDAGQTFFDLAPRVMMNDRDVDRAGLLGAGSRANHALLVAGESAEVAAFADRMRTEHPELEFTGVRDGSPQMRLALSRAERFLGLASVATVLLAGAAVALAVHHFALRQADASAVLRTLGAERGDVIRWLILRLAAVALVASLVGIAIGWLAQQTFGRLLTEWFSFALPAPGVTAPLVGFATAAITLAGFGLLPILRAGQVDVMRVLRRDYASLQGSTALTLAVGLTASFLVVWLLSGDALLSAIVLGGVLAMLLVLAVCGGLLIGLVRRLLGARYRLATAGLARRAGSSRVQLAAFAMGIMALLLISIVRVDLLAAWEQDLPEDASNVFIVNIQPDQREGMRAQLAADGIDAELYPMVWARLVAENGEVLTTGSADEEQRLRMREDYNLSYTNVLPEDNTIVAGEWWGERGTEVQELSLDADFAESVGYELGDTVTFDIAGIERTATITSLREIEWERFRVNFFALGTPALLRDLPATFVTSFHSDDDFVTATSGWARAFPGIATLDVGAIVERVRRLMDRASLAVEYVFLFTLVAGLCVLLAAVQSSQAERIREAAVLRALGASHAQIRRQVVAEFVILGALAGFLAAFFATLISWGLSTYTLELPWQPNLWLWLFGIVGGGIGISLAGYLATRRVLRTPPLLALRHGS